MLETSIFSFSHSVFHSIKNKNCHISSICHLKCFQFGHVQNFVVWLTVNSLPNSDIFEWSKLKAFTDDKTNVAEMLISLSDRIENIVGNRENTGNQHYLLFPQCY